jgi:hypothetical protein
MCCTCADMQLQEDGVDGPGEASGRDLTSVTRSSVTSSSIFGRSFSMGGSGRSIGVNSDVVELGSDPLATFSKRPVQIPLPQRTHSDLTSLSSSFSFESSTATRVATATFDSIRALFAGRLLPLVSSLILASMNGVLACPWNPCSAASLTAWSIAKSISFFGIENSSGMGLAKSSPEAPKKKLCETVFC